VIRLPAHTRETVPALPDDLPGPKAVSRRQRLRHLIGFLVGLALFSAAIWAIAHGGADVRTAIDAARHAPWWLVAAVLLFPALNWLLVSLSFHVLHTRYAPVGRVEMSALIASAWLLNYLPLKPGMFGRLAYHKKVNGIRFADSARVLLVNVMLTGASIGALVAIAVLVRLSGATFGWVWGWVWCVPLPAALGVAAIVLRARSRERGGGAGWPWRLCVSGLLRFLDMMVWVGRYSASFALIGSPLDFESALVVAAVSQVALLVPLAGNGLGLREWGVRAATEPVGLLADVVNRAAELAVSVPLGLAGSAYAARRLARHRSSVGVSDAGESGDGGESGGQTD
jgi:hypothetical protein